MHTLHVAVLAGDVAAVGMLTVLLPSFSFNPAVHAPVCFPAGIEMLGGSATHALQWRCLIVHP
jgi:hypothetical protein